MEITTKIYGYHPEGHESDWNEGENMYIIVGSGEEQFNRLSTEDWPVRVGQVSKINGT